MLANLRILAFACCLILVSGACNGDDTDRRPRVLYSVTASSDIITAIDFKGFNGEQAQVAESAAVPGWSQQVLVNLPFTALLNANLVNNGETAVTYSLQIIADGQPIGEKTGTLEPGATVLETLSSEVTR